MSWFRSHEGRLKSQLFDVFMRCGWKMRTYANSTLVRCEEGLLVDVIFMDFNYDDASERFVLSRSSSRKVFTFRVKWDLWMFFSSPLFSLFALAPQVISFNETTNWVVRSFLFSNGDCRANGERHGEANLANEMRFYLRGCGNGRSSMRLCTEWNASALLFPVGRVTFNSGQFNHKLTAGAFSHQRMHQLNFNGEFVTFGLGSVMNVEIFTETTFRMSKRARRFLELEIVARMTNKIQFRDNTLIPAAMLPRQSVCAFGRELCHLIMRIIENLIFPPAQASVEQITLASLS